jgi:hypothetical protein
VLGLIFDEPRQLTRRVIVHPPLDQTEREIEAF